MYYHSEENKKCGVRDSSLNYKMMFIDSTHILKVLMWVSIIIQYRMLEMCFNESAFLTKDLYLVFAACVVCVSLTRPPFRHSGMK